MKNIVLNILCFLAGVAAGVSVMLVRCMEAEDYIKTLENDGK